MRNPIITLALVLTTACGRQDGEVDPSSVANPAAPSFLHVEVTKHTMFECIDHGLVADIKLEVLHGGPVEISGFYLNTEAKFGRSATVTWHNEQNANHSIIWNPRPLYPRQLILVQGHEIDTLNVVLHEPLKLVLEVNPDDCPKSLNNGERVLDSVSYRDSLVGKSELKVEVGT